MFGADRKVFVRTHPERTLTCSVQNIKPFAVWFVGALDGRHTFRTQVALDDNVDQGVVIPYERLKMLCSINVTE